MKVNVCVREREKKKERENRYPKYFSNIYIKTGAFIAHSLKKKKKKVGLLPISR